MNDKNNWEEKVEYWKQVINTVNNHDVKGIRYLMDDGLDMNYRSPFDSTANEDTLLFYAVADEGATEIIKVLLEYGADINLIINSTALYHAVNNNHLGVVNHLLRKGAFVDELDNTQEIFLKDAKQLHNEIINTPYGTVELQHNYITDESTQSLFNAIDLQRATQLYMWSTPL